MDVYSDSNGEKKKETFFSFYMHLGSSSPKVFTSRGYTTKRKKSWNDVINWEKRIFTEINNEKCEVIRGG